MSSASTLAGTAPVGGATEATQLLVLAAVDGLEGFTDGIEGFLSTIAINTTSIAAEDFATETTLASILSAVDGLEGFTDGLETLIGTTNTELAAVNVTLTAISGFVDGLEGFTDGIEGFLSTIATNTTNIAAEDFATETTLAAMSAKLPATLGQKPMATSFAVVIASDQSVIPVSPSYLSVIDQIDTTPGPVLDTAVDNIQDNAGVFLTVVASLAAAVKKIRVADTTGEFIGVYTGPAASEVLAFIINPGQDDAIEHAIPAATRVSLRSMGTTDITTGLLAMQFLG